MRNRRWLLMLQTYLDDSGIGAAACLGFSGLGSVRRKLGGVFGRVARSTRYAPQNSLFQNERSRELFGGISRIGVRPGETKGSHFYSQLLNDTHSLAVATVVPDHLYRGPYSPRSEKT